MIDRTDYQMNFIPSCIWRASNVCVIVPNAPLLRFPFGARKFVRFRRLNASTRTSSRTAGPNARCLLAATSICQNSGPLTLFRAALPNGWLGSVGTTTVLRFSQLPIVRSPFGVSGSPVTFGR